MVGEARLSPLFFALGICVLESSGTQLRQLDSKSCVLAYLDDVVRPTGLRRIPSCPMGWPSMLPRLVLGQGAPQSPAHGVTAGPAKVGVVASGLCFLDRHQDRELFGLRLGGLSLGRPWPRGPRSSSSGCRPCRAPGCGAKRLQSKYDADQGAFALLLLRGKGDCFRGGPLVVSSRFPGHQGHGLSRGGCRHWS